MKMKLSSGLFDIKETKYSNDIALVAIKNLVMRRKQNAADILSFGRGLTNFRIPGYKINSFIAVSQSLIYHRWGCNNCYSQPY